MPANSRHLSPSLQKPTFSRLLMINKTISILFTIFASRTKPDISFYSKLFILLQAVVSCGSYVQILMLISIFSRRHFIVNFRRERLLFRFVCFRNSTHCFLSPINWNHAHKKRKGLKFIMLFLLCSKTRKLFLIWIFQKKKMRTFGIDSKDVFLSSPILFRFSFSIEISFEYCWELLLSLDSKKNYSTC